MLRLQFIFLLFPFLLPAQPKTTQTPTYSTDKPLGGRGLVQDATSGKLFFLRHEYTSMPKVLTPSESVSRHFWGIDVFSPDLKQLKSNPAKVLDVPDGEDVENGWLMVLGGKPYLVALRYEKKRDQSTVYQAAIDAEGMLAPARAVGTLAGKLLHSGQLMVSYAADSSRVLLAQHPSRSKPQEPFSFIVFGPDGQVERQGNLAMSGSPSDRAVGYPIIANDGAIWAPVWIDAGEALRQEVWIWRAGQAGPAMIDVAFSPEKIITDLQLAQSPYDGAVYAGGTFAESTDKARRGLFSLKDWNKDPNPEQGSVALKLDGTSGKVLSASSHPFTPTTLKFWDKKPGGAIKSLRAARVLPLRDGSVWVGLEQFYQNMAHYDGKAYATSHSTIQATPFLAGNHTDGLAYGNPVSLSIILAQHTATGALQREHVIARFMWFLGAFDYFLTASDRGDVMVIYDDHVKNIEQPRPEAKYLEFLATGGFRRIGTGVFSAGPGTKTTTGPLFTENDKIGNLTLYTFARTGPNRWVFARWMDEAKYGLIQVEW